MNHWAGVGALVLLGMATGMPWVHAGEERPAAVTVPASAPTPATPETGVAPGKSSGNPGVSSRFAVAGDSALPSTGKAPDPTAQSTGSAGSGVISTPNELFEAAIALLDAAGKPIVTGKALGCPYAVDYNGDGKIDVVLGAHESMKTPFGGIWLIPNVGTNAEPRHDWAQAWRARDKNGAVQVSCGCQSAGDTFVQPCDWNDDGFLDIAVSDSYAEAYILINDGSSRDKPVYTREPFFKMEKVNHGMMAGGGDWNQDGVRDFLHMPFAGAVYKVFPGKAQAKGGLRFEDGGLKKCTVVKVEGAPMAERATSSAWAWDFSGTAKRRGVIEYVGIGGDKKTEICLFEVKAGKSQKIQTLATFDAMLPQCTASDLNGDGRLDVLFSGGDFDNEKSKTKIYVMLAKTPKP